MKKLYDLLNSEAQKYLITALAILLVGAMFVGMTVQDAVSSSRDPVDFNAIGMSQCKAGTHVTGDVLGTIGYYWESYDTVNGRKQESSTERIYLIPFGTEGRYIGINVRENDFERFDALETETYASFDNNTYPEPLMGYDGYIKKCDKRMKSALEEVYTVLGGTGDANELFVPYYIELTSDTSMPMLFIGIGILVVAVIFFVIFIVKYREEKAVINLSTYVGKVIFDRNDYTPKEREMVYETPDISDFSYENPPESEALNRQDNPEITRVEDPFDTGEVTFQSTLRMKTDDEKGDN